MSLEAEYILCFPVFDSLNNHHRARIIAAIQTSSFKLTDRSSLMPFWGSLSQFCYDYFPLIINAHVSSYKLSVKVFKPLLRDLSTFYFSSKDGPSLDDHSSPICSILSHSVCVLAVEERDYEMPLSLHHLMRQLSYSTGWQNNKSSFYRCRIGPWHSATMLATPQTHAIEALQAKGDVQNTQLWH